MSERIIYTADAIALYKATSSLVLVERLSSVPGFSLPGGKQDPGESLSETVVREMDEETDLSFVPEGVFGTYAEAGRDPRGNYVTTVFFGYANGVPHDEPGKTKVHIVPLSDLLYLIPKFVFDHGKIVTEYLKYRRSRQL
ncbi:MAG: hydrolase [Parcubacteria group bacterium]|nr:hydrolase [Parcubacteria group bacterium]